MASAKHFASNAPSKQNCPPCLSYSRKHSEYSYRFHVSLRMRAFILGSGSRVCLLLSGSNLPGYSVGGSNTKKGTLDLALCTDPNSMAFPSSLSWNRLEAADPSGTCLSTINLQSELHQSCGTKLGLFSSNSKELTNT